MRFVLAAAVALAAITAAFALPAGARMTAPGPQCGGTLWKQMTLSDTGKSAVQLDAGSHDGPRHREAQCAQEDRDHAQHRVPEAGVACHRCDPELPDGVERGARAPAVRRSELDVHERLHAESACLASTARGRAQMIATRNGFLQQCGAASNNWTPLGATADLTGVGFWNSVKTTAGAAKNGAELRPVLSVNITQGCGKF